MRYLVCVLFAWGCMAQPADSVYLVGATVYDGTGGPAIEDAVVQVDDGRIACVGTRAECPVGDGAVVDISGRFVTPGLVDAHVHFSQTGWLDGRPDSPLGREFYDYEALQRRLRAHPERWHRAYLCTGITAVFDVGGFPWTIDYSGEGSADRAHVSSAGPLITHADNPHLRALGADTFLPMGSDEEAIASVRQIAEWGADAVKVWYLDPTEGSEEVLMQRLMKMATEARSLGLPLIVHATQLENAKTALRAGASMLVHSVDDRPVDEEFLRLARENDAVYVPTLLVGRNWTRAVVSVGRGKAAEVDDPNGCVGAETLDVINDAAELHEAAPESLKDPERLAAMLERAKKEVALMQENLRRVAEAGITVATGTDAGNPLTVHGPSIYKEMEAMQAAGLPARDIIVMSTRNGALAMGRLEDFGTLEAGKIADLVVLEEDPGADVRAFRSIERVMRGGVLREVEEFRR